MDNSCKFLKVGTKVRKSAVEDAAEEYEKTVDDGRLKYNDKELGCAISNQAALVMAQHYLNNPPSYGACVGLVT